MLEDPYGASPETEEKARDAYQALRSKYLRDKLSPHMRRKLFSILVDTRHPDWMERTLRSMPDLSPQIRDTCLKIIVEAKHAGSASRALRFLKVPEEYVAPLAATVIAHKSWYLAFLTLSTINPITDKQRYDLIELAISHNDKYIASLIFRRRKVTSPSQRQRLKEIAGLD